MPRTNNIVRTGDVEQIEAMNERLDSVTNGVADEEIQAMSDKLDTYTGLQQSIYGEAIDAINMAIDAVKNPDKYQNDEPLAALRAVNERLDDVIARRDALVNDPEPTADENLTSALAFLAAQPGAYVNQDTDGNILSITSGDFALVDEDDDRDYSTAARIMIPDYTQGAEREPVAGNINWANSSGLTITAAQPALDPMMAAIEVDWNSNWMRNNSFPEGVHRDIDLLLRNVQQARTELETHWPTPGVQDSVLFAITEIGEYVDARLRMNEKYNRNNDKSLDPRAELGDVAIMLATAIMQLPVAEGHKYIHRKREIDAVSIMNVLHGITMTFKHLQDSETVVERQRNKSVERQRGALNDAEVYRKLARNSLLSALGECYLLCGEDSLTTLASERLIRIRRRILDENPSFVPAL